MRCSTTSDIGRPRGVLVLTTVGRDGNSTSTVIDVRSTEQAPDIVAADQPPDERDVRSGGFVDVDHPAVRRFVDAVLSEAGLDSSASDTSRAVALFTAVRDRYRYDPYSISRDPDDYRAGAVAGGSQSWCVPKATLLTAAARAVGIPARVGFADVKNHLQSQRLRERMGTDLFLWHGYSVLWLGDRWLKVSPAFNRELCERFGTRVLEFDGRSDALLHEFDNNGHRHMEYINHRGVYRDIPLVPIFATFDRYYPDLA